jgi:hypothetical protein
MGVGGERHTPDALPPGKTPYPLYTRPGGPQGRSGRMRKISPPPGFDPWTVQPVASRYTHWAIAAHQLHIVSKLKRNPLTESKLTPCIILHNYRTFKQAFVTPSNSRTSLDVC